MAGQIIKRGENTWLVRIFTGRDVKGKRNYHNHTVKGTKKDAQTYLTAKLREKDTGMFIEPSPMSLNDYLDKWLETVKTQVRVRTAQNYKDILGTYARPILGHRRLSDIKPLDVQALYSSLMERGLSANTVRNAHVILKSAFKQAVGWRMIPFSPVADVKPPKKAKRREIQVLSPEDAKRFLSCAIENRYYALFHLAISKGLRPEEYLGLLWENVDLNAGLLHVRTTMVMKRGGGWYFGEPKSASSRRTLTLPASTVRVLLEHRSKQAEERLRHGSSYKNNGLVFATSSGAPVDMANLRTRCFMPIIKRAKLPENFTLYSLRHSFVTLSLLAGVEPRTVSEEAGHSSVSFTLDVYAHVLPSMKQSAAEKFEKLLFAGVGTL
jgi:integrase